MLKSILKAMGIVVLICLAPIILMGLGIISVAAGPVLMILLPLMLPGIIIGMIIVKMNKK